MIQTGQRDTRLFVRKPRNLVALAIFGVVLGRTVYNHLREQRLLSELMGTFDLGRDQHLNAAEMVRLLGANGVDISGDQVRKFFGRVDDEGDGFDNEELAQIMGIVADAIFCLGSAAGLAYLVLHSDAVEKKWAASSFHSAVLYRRMQAKCSKLDKSFAELSAERSRLEREIQELERVSSGDLDARQGQLKALHGRLEEITKEQEDTKRQLEQEVAKWQHEAEKSMREASMTSKKMERMMTCIKGLGQCVKGLEAFSGTGTGEFNSLGAQKGFCHVNRSIGFCMDSITFGTIENDKQGNPQLLMYETSDSRKLGEGRDCAYRCTDLTSGRELALKKYKISSQSQRHTIYNDLYAHLSQVGKHPRIVSYERVIESESTIFVLMELISGKDLFDVVAGQGLSEDQAKHLFKELVEGLQHLHDNGVIHCDVKPENAMVLGDVGSGDAHVKLIDFGCSCFKQYNSDLQGCIVWDQYMPPEHSANPRLTPAVATDMWRLGCTLYIMLLRRPPFHDDAETHWGREARENAQFCRAAPFDALSGEAKDLVASLLTGDPDKRPSTAQVLQHPWVRGAASG